MPFDRQVFSRPNLALAQQFMGGPQRPDSPYANRYPNVSSFSRTPAGQEIMARVLRNMQARRGRRPAGGALGQRPALSNTSRRP